MCACILWKMAWITCLVSCKVVRLFRKTALTIIFFVLIVTFHGIVATQETSLQDSNGPAYLNFFRYVLLSRNRVLLCAKDWMYGQTVRRTLGVAANVMCSSFARRPWEIWTTVLENAGGHVLIALFAMMGSVLISKMILAIVGLVLRSVLNNLGAPMQCVIMVADWAIKILWPFIFLSIIGSGLCAFLSLWLCLL